MCSSQRELAAAKAQATKAVSDRQRSKLARIIFLELADTHLSSAPLSALLLQENAAKKSASDVSKSPPKAKSSGKEEEEEIKSSAATKAAAPKTVKISGK